MSNLHIRQTTESFGTFVALSGRADLAADADLSMLVTRLAAARPGLLVIDLSDLTLITSLALGHLVALWHALKLHKCRMALVGLSPEIREVFAKARLINYFEIHETLAGALRGIQESPTAG